MKSMKNSQLITAYAATALLLAINTPAQNLFVAGGDGSGYITEITPSGAQSAFASGFFSYPGALAFNSVGNLFMGVGNTVYEFTPDGTASTFASDFADISGLAFNSAGELNLTRQP